MNTEKRPGERILAIAERRQKLMEDIAHCEQALNIARNFTDQLGQQPGTDEHNAVPKLEGELKRLREEVEQLDKEDQAVMKRIHHAIDVPPEETLKN